MEKDSGFRSQDSGGEPTPPPKGERASGLNPESRILNPVLLIGYGNPYRRDDGVAWHVINALRTRLGRSPLPLDEIGEDDLGHAIDTVMAHQLVPELALLLPPYSRVIFVDAHIGEIPVPLRVIEVEPGGEFQATTHHFGPGMLLALAQAQSGASPRGWLVSIRGDDFDYGETLTEACAGQVDRAVDEILRLVVRPEMLNNHP